NRWRQEQTIGAKNKSLAPKTNRLRQKWRVFVKNKPPAPGRDRSPVARIARGSGALSAEPLKRCRDGGCASPHHCSPCRDRTHSSTRRSSTSSGTVPAPSTTS